MYTTLQVTLTLYREIYYTFLLVNWTEVYLLSIFTDNKDVEMKDTMGHFTLEVIGACAFGIKCDALDDENAHFVKVGPQSSVLYQQ